jgi:serine/threonine-protein kinase RsbT
MNEIIDIEGEVTIKKAMIRIAHLCKEIGFNQLETNMVQYSLSELITNVIKYAQTGVIHLLPMGNLRGLRVLVKDSGPGIDNIPEAMKDGFSTMNGSLGIGLGGASRAMDRFQICSNAGQGTEVIMEKWLPIDRDKIDYAVLSMPKQANAHNGDAYLMKEYHGDSVFIGIIDGLGDGLAAYQKSQFLLKEMEQIYLEDLDMVLNKMRSNLSGQLSDLVSSFAFVQMNKDTIKYLIFGNAMVKMKQADKTITELSGAVLNGHRKSPDILKGEIANQSGSILMICTNGLSKDIHVSSQKESLPASMITRKTFEKYRKKDQDATLAIIKTN